METISIKLNTKQIEQLKDMTMDLVQVSPPQYANYAIKDVNISIVVYNSQKVVFSGKLAKKYSKPFQVEIILPQAGSDETGNGSYFGPICVCAAYIDEKTYNKIKHLKLDDSKMITDQYILEVGKFLSENVLNSLLVLDNLKYNQIQKKMNQNRMKAILHNQAFLNLEKKVKNMPKHVIIDQFTPKDLYFRYLEDQPKIYKDLIFETKAEGKYLAVAVGSIIARYAFLMSLKAMGEQYNFNFLSGAGSNVDKNAQDFVNKYSKEQLKNVAKLHFANTKKLK